MGPFTFVPVWVIQDVLIYLAGAAAIFYMIKREAHPIPRILEMFTFILLTAAVFENFATVIGLYGYGESLIMVFNVPLSIPLFEYLVLYAALRLFENMKMPVWLQPIGAGFLAVIADFTLDPVSVKQTFDTLEGTMPRWEWYMQPGWAAIYGEPVSNFTGWMTMIAFAATFLLLGRAWFRRSGYKTSVGYAYPVLAALASLIVTVSPINQFLLGLVPFFPKHGMAEWVMLGVSLIAPVVLAAIFWRGRMHAGYSLKAELPILYILVGFPVINVIFTLLGGYTQILWLEVLFMVIMAAVVAVIIAAGRRADRSLDALTTDAERSTVAAPR